MIKKNRTLIEQLFSSVTSLRIKKSSYLVFVCGRNTTETGSLRKIFLEFASKHKRDFDFFIAEDFFVDDRSSLLKIENFLAKYSDSILLFLESESAFAELGAFSNRADLVKKMIVVNDKRFEGGISFIDLGPLHEVNSQSDFGDVIYSPFESILLCCEPVFQKLETHKRKKEIGLERFLIKNKERGKLFAVHDFLSVAYPISDAEIKAITADSPIPQLRFVENEVKLLCMLKLFRKDSNGYYIKTKKNPDTYISFPGFLFVRIRSQIIVNYRRNSPDRLGWANQSAGEDIAWI